jgi:hypothetical protein
MSVYIHTDTHVGMTVDQITVKEINNVHGQHYWIATAPIGSIFGSEVQGAECKGIGRTKEEALERLQHDLKNFNDSLWE